MKKSLIILTVFLLVLAIFTGCGNKKIKGTDNVTMAGEGEIPALTEKGGELARDDDGRMIVAMTDENGEAIKTADGGVATTAVEVSVATLIGDTVESRFFSVTSPKGWRYAASYKDVIVTSDDDNKTNKIVFSSRSLEEQGEKTDFPGQNLYSVYKGACVIEKEETKTVKIAGIEANCERLDISGAKITDDVSAEQAAKFELRVISFYTFKGPDAVYGIRCESKDAGTADKVFEEVINTMVLY